MRKTLWVIALVVIAALAPLAHADSTTYVINFTLTSGSIAPTSGSFTYDSTTPAFSNFIVIWDGLSFDLTASANNPSHDGTLCGTSHTASDTFAFLSGTSPCAPSVTTSWRVGPFGIISEFDFFTTTNQDNSDFYIYSLAHVPPGFQDSGEGQWVISPVPEPSSVILMSSALLAVAFRARKRIEKRMR